MSIFLDPTRKVEYVLEAQRELPEVDRFRFLLHIITARRWSRMLAEEADQAATEARKVMLADMNLFLLRYGCDGWKAPEGQPAAVLDADGRLTWESLDLIPPTYRVELADAIWKLNTVFERDLGNLPQP